MLIKRVEYSEQFLQEINITGDNANGKSEEKTTMLNRKKIASNFTILVLSSWVGLGLSGLLFESQKMYQRDISQVFTMKPGNNYYEGLSFELPENVKVYVTDISFMDFWVPKVAWSLSVLALIVMAWAGVKTEKTVPEEDAQE